MKLPNLPKKMDREFRSFVVPDLKESGNGTIEGHAAVFGQQANIGGWFLEIIERGAFEKTDFRDVVLSVNHDLKKIPLARSRNNNADSTLQLSVDDAGLYTKASLDTENNSDARALYSAIGRSDITGMSFIFKVREDSWEGLDTDLPIRHIIDIAQVFEVSAVSFPAYGGTDINARDQQALESAYAALVSARSGLVSSSNELEVLRLKNQILMKG